MSPQTVVRVDGFGHSSGVLVVWKFLKDGTVCRVQSFAGLE
jgi:hypothetical protein